MKDILPHIDDETLMKWALALEMLYDVRDGVSNKLDVDAVIEMLEYSVKLVTSLRQQLEDVIARDQKVYLN